MPSRELPVQDQRMSTEENKQVVRRFIERVYTRLDASAVDELVAESFESHGTPSLDTDGLREATLRMGKALDNVTFQVDDVVAEGDRVAVRLKAGARQVGEFMGMPASGRSYAIEEIHIFRLSDGRIAEHWHQLDAMSLMGQLKGEAATRDGN